jgi:ABC-type transporter Mla subunit MlaD
MSRFALQLRRYGRAFLVYLLLVVIGTGAGFYILIQQRLPNPFKSFYKVNAAFPTAAAVVPGLGEPVDVAGVHVGQILGVQLHAGQGLIQMEIDPTMGVRAQHPAEGHVRRHRSRRGAGRTDRAARIHDPDR